MAKNQETALKKNFAEHVVKEEGSFDCFCWPQPVFSNKTALQRRPMIIQEAQERGREGFRLFARPS